jgi:hypothetical protein
LGDDMGAPIRGILSPYAAAAVKEGAAARSVAGPFAISVSAAIRSVQRWLTGGHAEARPWAATIASCRESIAERCSIWRPSSRDLEPARAFADPSFLPRNAAWRRGSPLLFLAVTGIISASTIVSLFVAGLVLLVRQEAATRPALQVQPTSAAVVEKSQFRIEAGATHSPLPPSGAPGIEPLAAGLQPGPATFAMAQGNARFAAGEVSVARVYFQQAVDVGDADGAVRTGEPFHPTFCRFDRDYWVPGPRLLGRRLELPLFDKGLRKAVSGRVSMPGQGRRPARSPR